MEELYWITRIGVISDTLCIIVILSCVISIVLGTFLLAEMESYDPTSKWESDRIFAKKYDALKKVWKGSSIIIIVTLVACIFIPSKKEMMLIYGGGKVIEFVENDSIAKQIPHEAVEVLHKYLTEE